MHIAMGKVSYIGNHLIFLNMIILNKRDIKLENILVKFTKGKGFEVKLADFGAAAFCTSTNLIPGKYGTVLYMAPEIHSNLRYSQTIDIWSLGILTYILITG